MQLSQPFRSVQYGHVHVKNSLSFFTAGAIFDQAMTHWTVQSNFPVRRIMKKGNAYRERRSQVVLDFFLKI